MFTDYRYILLFVIFFITTALFLFRTYSRSERHQWRESFASFRWWESGIVLVMFFAFASGGWLWGRDARISNFQEQIGGFVIEKGTVDGEYDESYDCNCSTDSDGNTHCSTCWRTVYYRDFYYTHDIGDWFSENVWRRRVEKCQTCDVPVERIPLEWKIAYVGMPVSLDNSYTNYLAAVNEDKFENTYVGLSTYLPDICPVNQYGFSPDGRKNKALPIGFEPNDGVAGYVLSWNFAPVGYDPKVNLTASSVLAVPLYMDTSFGYLGHHVQADTYIYVVNSTQIEYADMCLAKWKNGSKNSVYVFLFGQSNGMTFTVSDVVVGLGVDGSNKNTELIFKNEAERSNYYLKYDIREQLMTYFNSGGLFDRQAILTTVFTNVEQKFIRQEMAQFKELKKDVVPTNGWMLGLAIILAILNTIAHYVLAETKE